MPDVDKIQSSSGVTYDIRDALAQERIEIISQTIENINQLIVQNKQLIDTLNAEVSSITAEVSKNTQSIGDINTNIRDLSLEISSNTNAIATLTQQVNNDIKNVIDTLGNLAFKDTAHVEAGGTLGFDSNCLVDDYAISSKNVAVNQGSLPSLTAGVEVNGILKLTFNKGSLPAMETIRYVNSIMLKKSGVLSTDTNVGVK